VFEWHGTFAQTASKAARLLQEACFLEGVGEFLALTSETQS